MLDAEHVATLLHYLAALADRRDDTALAAFHRGWADEIETARDAVRDAAIALADDPDDAVRPAESSALGRAGHGAATAFGTLGEAFDGSPLGQRRAQAQRPLSHPTSLLIGWDASAMRRVTLVLAAVLLMSPAASADAADPARWTPTGTTSLPLEYWQGVTVDPERNLYFDGFVSGLYRTDPALQETGRTDDAIPPSVRMGEGYNHIGDISWDAGEGGRLLLPLECYSPGEPNGGNTCGTGSIGVADPQSLQWRYYVKLDPSEIRKAMWNEASPDGELVWTSSGNDLLAYRATDVVPANEGPAGAPIHSVRRLPGAVPPSGITGATFVGGRLFVAGQGGGPFRVWSIDLTTGARVLEAERDIAGESEGLATASVNGGTLQWLIAPFDPQGRPPTYGAGHSTLLSFRPGPPDPPAARRTGDARRHAVAAVTRRVTAGAAAQALARDGPAATPAARARELPGRLQRADHGACPRSHHRPRHHQAVRPRGGAPDREGTADVARALSPGALDAAHHRPRRGRPTDAPDPPRGGSLTQACRDEVAEVDLVAHVAPGRSGARARCSGGRGCARTCACSPRAASPGTRRRSSGVVVAAHRDAAGHRAGQLRRVEAPRLARVAAEERLIELAADPADHGVLGVGDEAARSGTGGVEGLDLRVGAQPEPVEAVERGAIDREREQLPVDLGQHPVLVGPPLGEAREIAPDLLGLRVEDVRPVAVAAHAVLVDVVVRVAGDVVAAVDHEHALPAARGEPLGQHRAGEARAHHQRVVLAPHGGARLRGMAELHTHILDRRRRGHQLPAAGDELVDALLLEQDDPRPAAVLHDRPEPRVAERPAPVAAREPLARPVDVGVAHPAAEQRGDHRGLRDVLDRIAPRLGVGLRGADEAAARPLADRVAGHARQLAHLAGEEAAVQSRNLSHRP